jgi:hypothetical protein
MSAREIGRVFHVASYWYSAGFFGSGISGRLFGYAGPDEGLSLEIGLALFLRATVHHGRFGLKHGFRRRGLSFPCCIF